MRCSWTIDSFYKKKTKKKKTERLLKEHETLGTLLGEYDSVVNVPLLATIMLVRKVCACCKLRILDFCIFKLNELTFTQSQLTGLVEV